ncbi:sorting nexin-29 isoform X2 [Schistocerca serialis cubense]|uniref:sorting nexin-29 isoform X2 n=1 Tax=Schistocerca serialis cubense TaxID=2023355 RepID=UPI00214F3820|nr:sorting nexin-29 isoform X2 [Schistocerca serialis cubense]
MIAAATASGLEHHQAAECQALMSELLEAVKRCQVRFGGRAELATESDPCVALLCHRMEAALSHGLRSRAISKTSSAFRHMTEIVSTSLHIGRGGAQDQLGLGSILFAISIDNSDLNGGTATMETESVGTPLSRSEPVIPPVTICVTDAESKKKKDQRRRKRVPAQIVNFDDEPSESETAGSPADSECSTAPKVSIESAETEERQQNFSRVEQVAEEVGMDAAAASLTACSRPYDLTLPSSAGRRSGSPPRRHAPQTLTPVNNVNVGELIPVSQGVASEEPHSEDDSLSVPSYSEDTDRAAAALLATQKLLQSNLVDMSPHELTSSRSTQDSHGHYQVNGEVREALFTVLALKEELQAESRSLKKLVEQMQETNTHLQAEMSEKQRQHTEKTERLEARIQALARENELLKHQLRKYVGAVQMLKRDGMQAYEALASLEGQQSRPVDPADYHHEAQEYEKKLIQVAEMHGELMEFNDRLHRQLQSKEAALRRLREELVDLRGPLPDDAHTSDEDAASITSDYDVSSLGAAARALVNIWIPSAFLTGGSSDVHHVYQVFVRIRDDEWNIYRRYAQFYSLHKQLKKQDAVFTTFDFPPKKTLGNKDSRFVEERRRRLQHYLRCVVNHLVQTNNEMATSPDKDLLVSLVPFFGDSFAAPDDRSNSHKKGTSSCSRSLFSRLGRSAETRAAENTPQYTGL